MHSRCKGSIAVALLAGALLIAAPAAARAQAAPAPSPSAGAAVPLSLDAAVALALKRNLQYRSVRIAVESSAARLQQTRSPELPSLAISDSFQYVDNIAKLSTPLGQIPFSTVNATNVPLVALQYTLFDGGATAARVGQALAGLSASEAQARQARGDVVSQVAAAYYGLLAASRMNQVAQRAVAVAAAHVRQAQQLLAGGMIPRADLLRAQAELANERVNAIAAANGVSLAQVGLDNVLDEPLTTRYLPTDPLGGPAPALDLNALLASARAQRGDLAAARAAVTAAQRAVDAARSGFLPHLNAVLSDGNTQPAVVGGYHNQFSAGLSAVWSLFDNGYTAGRVAEANAGVSSAQLGVQQLANAVDLQVEQAYLKVNEASARVQASQQLVALADENLRLAQVRYRGGVGTALELQDAELGDRSAHQTLTQAQAALRQGVVALRFAAGLL
jgi:outer membrane protein